MPKTHMEWQAAIHDTLNARHIDRSNSAVRRMAARLEARERRIEAQGEVLTYEQGMRILGILSDPTPREAIRNVEAVA